MQIGLWKKGFVLGIIVLFVGAGIIPSTGTVVEKKPDNPISNGKTLYVGGSGTGNYSTIQSAINDSSDGDTVFVFNGTYYERMNHDYGLVVDKSINLIGEDKNTTVIDGNKSEYAVYLSSDWVNISKFTVRNGGIRGIVIASNHNTITRNNIASNIVYGMIILYSNDNEISYNKISDNQIGLSLLESNNNFITENNISTTYGSGISLYESCENTITKNNINSQIRACGLFLGNSNDNVIIDNNIFNNAVGIQLYYSSMFNIISNNDIHLNDVYGIKLEDSSNSNIIYHNNFFNNEDNAYDKCDTTWDDGKYGNYWDDYNGNDSDGDGIGDTPYPIIPHGDNEDRYPLGNFHPDKPDIDGPGSGRPGLDYNYTFVATDPEGDDVWYHIGWGDKEIIYIYGPYPSGEEITLLYNWSEKGTFTISAKAKDIYDSESNWSEFEVNIPRNRATSYLWYQWFLERFPLLKRLLNLLK